MYKYNAQIINIVDGDTVDCLIDLGFKITHKVRLRLKDINTKELNSKIDVDKDKAIEAKNYLAFLVGNTYLVETYRADKYGRYEAIIFLSEFKTLNDLLVENKLAERV